MSILKFLVKPKRRFYVKQNGRYLTVEHNTTPRWYVEDKIQASTFTDEEYDAIKIMLPNDHTLEIVK